MINPLQETIKLALIKIFKHHSYFDYMEVEQLWKLADIIIDSKTKQLLRTLHCIDYSEMTPEFLAWLKGTVINSFQKILTKNGMRQIQTNK